MNDDRGATVHGDKAWQTFTDSNVLWTRALTQEKIGATVSDKTVSVILTHGFRQHRGLVVPRRQNSIEPE